jgi:hypothetical protein
MEKALNTLLTDAEIGVSSRYIGVDGKGSHSISKRNSKLSSRSLLLDSARWNRLMAVSRTLARTY